MITKELLNAEEIAVYWTSYSTDAELPIQLQKEIEDYADQQVAIANARAIRTLEEALQYVDGHEGITAEIRETLRVMRGDLS